MAGSIAVTAEKEAGLTKYTVQWVSDSSGDVTENTFEVKSGELVQVAFTPGGGDTQPTDEYDVTVLDENGADVLAGVGANLSNTVPTAVVPVISTYFRRRLVAGLLQPVVDNAGNAKGGTIELLVR